MEVACQILGLLFATWKVLNYCFLRCLLFQFFIKELSFSHCYEGDLLKLVPSSGSVSSSDMKVFVQRLHDFDFNSHSIFHSPLYN